MPVPAARGIYRRPDFRFYRTLPKQATFKSGFGPIIFGILDVWLLIYGSLIYAKLKASWLECSACGGKLAHRRVSVCPRCNASFQ